MSRDLGAFPAMPLLREDLGEESVYCGQNEMESSSDHFMDDDRGLHACWDSILITLCGTTSSSWKQLCGTTSSSWKLLCRCELTQTELPKPQAHLGSRQRPAVAYSLGRPCSFTLLCLANTFSHVLGCEKNKLKINSVEI